MPKHNKLRLPLLAASLGGAVLAGFGLSFGRDIYKRTKNNIGIIIILILFCGLLYCIYLAGRNLTRGYDRSVMERFFKTYLGNIALLMLSWSGITIFLYFVLSIIPIDGEQANDGIDFAFVSLKIAALITLVCLSIGMLVGALQRSKRLKAFAIAQENAAFMQKYGFSETNAKDITHYDGNNQPLRLLEIQPGKIVFMAVGRRGKRAFINLDQEGRMLSYSVLCNIKSENIAFNLDRFGLTYQAKDFLIIIFTHEITHPIFLKNEI